jgi:hypothetical protein
MVGKLDVIDVGEKGELSENTDYIYVDNVSGKLLPRLVLKNIYEV